MGNKNNYIIVLFLLACIASALLAGGLTWIVVTDSMPQRVSRYYIEQVNGMNCIVFRDYGVSCDWRQWDENAAE